jgi:hypothetical protein
MSPDLRFALDEVLACDGRAIALRGRYLGTGSDGGGSLETPVGYVTVIKDGFHRVEQFESRDLDGMLARYRELGGSTSVLGNRPPERLLAEYFRRYVARDVEALSQLVTADVFTADHRRIRYGEGQGRDRFKRVLTAILGVGFIDVHVDELIACDDRTIAVRVTYRGSAPDDQIGEMEVGSGEVYAVRDGKFSSIELFEPDDRAAMLARYRELSGSRGLGDSPVERLLAQSLESYNARELDTHVAYHADDFVLVDHRSMGWDEVRGRQGLEQLVKSPSSTVKLSLDEVLACDGERVIAVRGAWRSQGSSTAGPWEIPIGFVTVVENEQIVSHELYEPDDVPAMFKR